MQPKMMENSVKAAKNDWTDRKYSVSQTLPLTHSLIKPGYPRLNYNGKKKCQTVAYTLDEHSNQKGVGGRGQLVLTSASYVIKKILTKDPLLNFE